MMTKRGTLMILGGVLLVALTLPACDPDPIFMSCPLSTSIIDVCKQQADGSETFTCVVADHPMCLERVCASWQAQPSVCTRLCTLDADCTTEADKEGASTCLFDDVLDLRFCVLKSHSEAADNGVIAGQ